MAESELHHPIWMYSITLQFVGKILDFELFKLVCYPPQLEQMYLKLSEP